MQQLLSTLDIQISNSLYLKDPSSSELGKRIVAGSVDLINELGLERFTFAKLAKRTGTTEASVYRYFENKHKVLLYLTTWYWGWMEYRLVFALSNIDDPRERLKRAVHLLTNAVAEDGTVAHIDEAKLHRIVIEEGTKTYSTREVDRENENGAFARYKRVIARVSELVTEIDPRYPYPHMLISTIVEGAHLQRFFADHLPRVTDVVEGEDAVVSFYTDLVFRALYETPAT